MFRIREGFIVPLVVRTSALLGCMVLLAAGTGCEQDSIDPDLLFNEKLGGETTAFSAGSNAFELSARNLSNEERRTFEVGDSFFTQNWVTAPASTEARDGLGPTFNAQSCSSCHVHDGRARPPVNDDDPVRGFLLKLSIPGPNGPIDEPNYGDQLQDRAILGIAPEGRILIRYEFIHGQYPDGETYSLRKPTYMIAEPSYGPLHEELTISPRIAPAVFGMGLLEAISEDDILAQADPDDTDGDGISGRPNMVWDIEHQAFTLGRFGWKAGKPTVEQQSAGAFLGDIGITSRYFPFENCPESQTQCATQPNGGSPEVPDERLGKVTFYVQTLAVPAMRNVDDSNVRHGAQLFARTGCTSCHTPRYTTADDFPIAPLRSQVIFPYTDLLLHDMGDGLADNRPEVEANGREWRTPPLWGIGLVKTVNGHTNFLHDGRARNLEEAILWHGGEAEQSKDDFMVLASEDRQALIDFLRSL